MVHFNARNVNEAWALFHYAIRAVADTGLNPALREVAPRGVRTLEFRDPVVTRYERPEECVLFDPVRDANPFFHLYEALWVLCGFSDVRRLRYYNPQIRAYSDDALTFHGAYGNRLRYSAWADGDNPHIDEPMDQLEKIVETLRADPDSRRAVAALWMPSLDIEQTKAGADIPCNTTLYFKVRDGALRITVCNRSNDAVWGAYGANAVQFSFVQQYVAAALKLPVGPYFQFSDSLHVYLEGKPGEVWKRCAATPPPMYQDYSPEAFGVSYAPLVSGSATQFLFEARHMLAPEQGYPNPERSYSETFLREVAQPMLHAHHVYREDGPRAARNELLKASYAYDTDAWIVAGRMWLLRRIESRLARGEQI